MRELTKQYKAGGAGQIGNGIAGAGVDCLELAHGGGLAAGGAGERQIALVGRALQTAAHGSAAPGGVADLVGDKACLFPLPAVDAVEHGQQEGAPGGLSGFVGCLKNIQAIFQLQRAVLQLAEGGSHAVDQQKNPSCKRVFI